MRSGIRFALLGMGILCGLRFGLAAEPVQRPNILLVMTDDQGWGDVHSHDNPHINTPVMDSLAASGARFDRFFVSPVCAPTRASLLTGRYNLRTRTHGVTRGEENMRTEEVTIAEIFAANGYKTGCFGKWHNGRHYPWHPNGQGFQEFVGFCAGHWNNYFNTTLEHNGEEFQSDGFIIDVLTDHALNFIEKHHDQPFLCYVPMNTPHTPWQVPEKYWQRYAHKDLPETTKCAYAMCENIDYNLGRLLSKLDELDLAKNTIVLFLTDNGANTDRYDGHMRGRKGSVDEGGVRVPLFVRWPDRIPAGRFVKPIAMHIDLLPTLVSLCGVDAGSHGKWDGLDLSPLLLADQTAADNWPDRKLFTFRGFGSSAKRSKGAVRTQRWRLVRRNPGANWTLYDMQTDPSQNTDLAKKHPSVVDELSEAYETIYQDVTQDSFEPLPIPLGLSARPTTVLPGHEAYLHPAKGQGIRYFGPAGWANDWISGWTNTESYPWWPVEVVEPGRYAVSLDYKCPKSQVGAKLTVAIGDKSLSETITQPHDPKPVPAPDRIARKEVMEFEWKSLPLGEVELQPAETRLIIRGANIQGGQLPEVKAVRVTRVDD
ncbi:sulfatase-like hydrolase/transferase [Thalassoroseus pseudoceratinae]|uniref:sulfatase-like hydrolase/transferase n=1 Tax=Thalassoroseus pseudoceratinae TaxID=2713176 RepID=UPI001420AAFE|nr:sulfatase-like hydrolase/transferase [Thalassoroseus pseudoceratinae]